jgi:hypothetical protein
MSTYEVLHRFGTAALLRFAALMSLFVALHLIRVPFAALAAGLDAAMRRVDAATTARVSTHDPHGRRERRASYTRPGGQSRQEQDRRAGVSGTHQGTGGAQW